MTTARALIASHSADLTKQKQTADWWWTRLLAAFAVLFVIAAICGYFDIAAELGSLASIAAVITLFLLMRKGDESRDLGAELLEFERPEFYDVDGDVDDNQIPDGAARQERLNFLSREIISRKRMRMVRNRTRYAEASGVILSSLSVMLVVWFALSLEDFLREYHRQDQSESRYSDEELYVYELEVVSIGLVALLVTGWAVTRFRSARSGRREIERLEIEHELMPVVDLPDASRARKLLMVNQRNLSSYYAINRFNSRVTLSVAILCVLAGIGITIWTIQSVLSSDTPATTSKLVVAAVGAVNAIMINVVAAIVLRIQSTISSNVSAFHDRLVRSHDIFLANVIAAEIDDAGLKRETLSAISKAIGVRGASKASHEKKSAKDTGKEAD